jgi:hypothetical protein
VGYPNPKASLTVSAYHTLTDPEDPVHHVYDDCPAGEVVIANGNDQPGTNSWDLCIVAGLVVAGQLLEPSDSAMPLISISTGS